MTDTTQADPAQAPVTLPSGSYDFDKLMQGLEAAAGASGDDRQRLVDEAILGSVADKGLLEPDDVLPHMERRLVEHPELDDVVEHVLVYVPDDVEDKVGADVPPADAAQVLDEARVTAAPDAAAPAPAAVQPAAASGAAAPDVAADTTADAATADAAPASTTSDGNASTAAPATATSTGAAGQ